MSLAENVTEECLQQKNQPSRSLFELATALVIQTFLGVSAETVASSSVTGYQRSQTQGLCQCVMIMTLRFQGTPGHSPAVLAESVDLQDRMDFSGNHLSRGAKRRIPVKQASPKVVESSSAATVLAESIGAPTTVSLIARARGLKLITWKI